MQIKMSEEHYFPIFNDENEYPEVTQSELERAMFRVGLEPAPRKPRVTILEETQLLQKINQGLPPAVQQRYDELTAKRRAETLTPEELEELMALIDRIEQADAERVLALTELAQLRNVTVTTLMDQVGIQRPPYA